MGFGFLIRLRAEVVRLSPYERWTSNQIVGWPLLGRYWAFVLGFSGFGLRLLGFSVK